MGQQQAHWGARLEGLLGGAHSAAPLSQGEPQTLGQGGGAGRGGSGGGGDAHRGGEVVFAGHLHGGRAGGEWAGGGRALRAGAPAGQVSDTRSLPGYI